MSSLLVGPSPGTVIDGFKVLKPLGDGGFGLVYLVEKHGKLYALKLARHREASGDDKRTHERTLRELEILLLLRGHPYIVQPCGYGHVPDKASGNVYLLLDYVDGWTLAQWMERKHPTVQEVLTVFVKLAAALAHMHSRGVLHRDLKPANVLIRKRDGEPVIIDFGAASHTLAAGLTEEGLPPGTERFRAPEQFRFLREHKEEHRARYAFQVSDEVFAYGVMLYDVLTDPRPTQVRPREAVNSVRRTPEAVHKLNPRVPVAVSHWVQSLLAREASNRPVDTEALRREAAELAAQTSTEYGVTVHLPSEQREPAPPEDDEPAALEEAAAKERPWPALRALAGRLRSRKVAAGGGLVAACLAGALALILSSGEVRTPAPASAPRGAMAPVPAPAVPMAPPESAPPAMSTPAPAPAVDTGPAATADTQKEGSTVTTQKPEAPKKVRPLRAAKQTPSAAVCKTLAFWAAVAAGCTGAPIRPEPFDCPKRIQTLMSQHGWENTYRFSLALDDRFERDSRAVFRPGAEVVSIVPKYGDAPEGTKLWGRVYVDPQDDVARGRGEPAALLVKYERAKFPGQEDFPVCIIGRSGVVYSVDKDGTATAGNSGEAYVTWFGYPFDILDR